jgi:excisionase family DNA binding protein
MNEILTVTEVAAMLKMSKGQIYEMTKQKTCTGSMKGNPLPVAKINGNLRFRKSDVEAWFARLVDGGAA